MQSISWRVTSHTRWSFQVSTTLTPVLALLSRFMRTTYESRDILPRSFVDGPSGEGRGGQRGGGETRGSEAGGQGDNDEAASLTNTSHDDESSDRPPLDRTASFRSSGGDEEYESFSRNLTRRNDPYSSADEQESEASSHRDPDMLGDLHSDLPHPHAPHMEEGSRERAGSRSSAFEESSRLSQATEPDAINPEEVCQKRAQLASISRQLAPL